MPHPKHHSRETLAVIHPPSLVNPDDWKRWILLPYFVNKWNHLRLSDDDLRALQIMVMLDPKASAVVEGTGGLRKVRFSVRGSGRGKRGSYRVGYAYYEEFGVIVAVAVYAKNDQSDIPAEQRGRIKLQLEKLYQWIEKGG